MLCGHPKDGGWSGVNDRVSKALLDAGERVWSEGCQRRGPFINASTGVLIGQGAKVAPPVLFDSGGLLMCMFGNSTLATSATMAPRRG